MLPNENIQKSIVKIENDLTDVKKILEDIHNFMQTIMALKNQMPVMSDGICHQCASTKVVAIDDERTCSKCNFKWVVPKEVEKYEIQFKEDLT